MFVSLVSMLKKRIWSNHEMLLLVHPAKKEIDELLHKQCTGKILPVSEANILDCAAFEDADCYVPVYRKMLANGDYGHYGYIEDICVFRHWLKCSGAIIYEGCMVRMLQEHENYVHYGFCAPNARGKGFHAESMRQFILSHFSDTSYALVSAENKSSLRACYRNGYVIRSRIIVKCRFLTRRLTEIPLTSAQAKELWPQ